MSRVLLYAGRVPISAQRGLGRAALPLTSEDPRHRWKDTEQIERVPSNEYLQADRRGSLGCALPRPWSVKA